MLCGTEKDGKNDRTFVQLDLVAFPYISSSDTLGIDKMQTRNTATIYEDTLRIYI